MICKYFRKRVDGATYRIQEVRLMIRKYFKKESWWLSIQGTGSTADDKQVLQKKNADGATYRIQEVRLMICKYFRKRADGATYRIHEVRLMIRKYFKKES